MADFVKLPDVTGTYSDNAGYGKAFMKIKDLQHGSGQDDSAKANEYLNQYGNQFSSQFKNLVGRAPTSDEISNFYDQVIAPVGTFPGGVYAGQQQLGDLTRSFISNNYSGAAEDQAKTDLTNQQGEATRLSDLLMSEGKKSLGDIASQLRDYQVSLFDKLRPQLNLSAQASGFADSGGQTLQEQGALTDLGNASTQFLLPQYSDLSNRALDVKYGGQSAPYLYDQNSILGRSDYLKGMGQSSLDRAFQSALGDQSYARQRDLMQYQNDLIGSRQPSFGSTLSQSFANKFGGGLADIGTSGVQGGMKAMAA